MVFGGFPSCGATVASCGEDRTIRGWRLRDGRAVWSKRDGGAVYALVWLDRARFATAGLLARPRIWRVDRDESVTLPPIDDWIYGLASGDGGKVLFTADWRGRLTAYSVAKRTIVERLRLLEADSGTR